MSREIKFRAWDADRKEMRHSDEGWNESADIFSGVWKSLERSGIVVMQFTGLRDRNGMEVYEGDVVCSEGGRKYVIARVSECNSTFLAKRSSTGNYTDIGTEGAASMAVIGNIHENPDLLDSAKVTESGRGS